MKARIHGVLTPWKPALSMQLAGAARPGATRFSCSGIPRPPRFPWASPSSTRSPVRAS